MGKLLPLKTGEFLLKCDMLSVPFLRDEEQLSLPFSRGEKMLEDYLRKMTGKDLDLILTGNGTTMISVHTRMAKVSVRLQRMFLEAPDEIIAEIAQFIKKGKGKTPLVRSFIRENGCRIERRPPRLKLTTAGRYHDLLAHYVSVNREYFGERIDAEITWGTRTHGSGVRRRTLGSYSPASNVIRINPVIDKRNVPSSFVKFIVYHEMLHADLGVERKNGRRAVHTREFRRREKLFLDYEKIVAWEKRWMLHKDVA